MMRPGLSAAGVGAALLLFASAALAQGGRFRNFESAAPRVGDKAPLLDCYDEEGKPANMATLLGPTHLVLVFGAWT